MSKTKSLSLYSENFLPSIAAYISLLIGVWFLNWNTGDLLTFLFLEMVIAGFAMAIRVLFSGANWLSSSGIIARLFQNFFVTWMFVVAYMTMMVVFVVFVLGSYTPEWGSMDQNVYGLTFWALCTAYGADLIFNYFGSKQYLKSSGIQIIFRTIFRTLPFVILSVFLILELAEYFPGNNAAMLTAIISVRIVLDYAAYRISRALGFNNLLTTTDKSENIKARQSDL